MKVIAFLKSWIVDIVIMFVFITVLQFMLPNNSMKRYIDVITGFLIIFVVINPFVKILTTNINLEQNYLLRYTESINENYYEEENFLNLQNQQMVELYKKNLEGKIKETIKKDLGYEILDINLTVVEDNEDSNYGQLIGVSMTINLDENKEESNENLIKIKKIKINDSKKDEKFKTEFKDEEKIKNIVSNDFNVPKENIEVFLNKPLEGD